MTQIYRPIIEKKGLKFKRQVIKSYKPMLENGSLSADVIEVIAEGATSYRLEKGLL